MLMEPHELQQQHPQQVVRGGSQVGNRRATGSRSRPRWRGLVEALRRPTGGLVHISAWDSPTPSASAIRSSSAASARRDSSAAARTASS